ncbi:MAG: tRNA lysidine(34) synthetase TilS [Acidobacteria bacterium]|nr:tRNA lysidine(34) synthetase TilS [Acidobacteriota bacterium]
MTLLRDLREVLDCRSIRRGRLVVAVSGGADSTALLYALSEAAPELELICAHINHQLRGEESERDASTVEDHARCLGVDLRVQRSSPDPELIRLSGVEAAARIARYDALRHIRAESEADWIATGHTMDDQAETVLQKLMTSSPTESLRGIIPMSPDGIVRPLLGIRRNLVHDWLHERAIPHRFDASNDDMRFLRNRVRHLLLPKLEALDDHVVPRLASIAAHLYAIEERLTPLRNTISAKWRRTAHRTMIAETDLPRDRAARRIILLDELHRLVPAGREVSSKRLETLPEDLHASGRISIGEGVDARVEDGVIILERIGEESQLPFSRTIHCGESVRLPELGASMSVRRVDSAVDLTDAERRVQVFSLPAGVSTPAFIIRNRREGDRFQPLGMEHAKKLKDFLIDRKIPRGDRDALPLLVFGNEIIWIAGVEVSDRFRVSPGRDLYEVRIDYGI